MLNKYSDSDSDSDSDRLYRPRPMLICRPTTCTCKIDTHRS